MKTSVTTSCLTAIPGLRYTDAPRAIAWLSDAFGAEARTVIPMDDGSVAHAELWFGTACVMLGSLRDATTPPTVAGESSVYITVDGGDAVAALYQRAVDHGAKVVKKLGDTPYGSREFGVLDLEGNSWSFGTYVPT